jgi:hypothetical protein
MEETTALEAQLIMDQNIPPIMQTFALFGLLVYAAMIVAGVVVVIAIWRGMRAHERMADSMKRMADAAERIEKSVRRDGEPRV